MNQDKLLEWIKRFLKAALCFAIFYFSGYLQYIPVWIFHITKITPTIQIYLSLFSNLIAAIIIGLLWYKDLRKEATIFKEHCGNCMDIGLKYWVLGLFLMMSTNIVINLFSSNHIAGNEQVVQAMIEKVPWIMLINAGFIAPFVEEITFRKTFRTLFQKKWAFALLSGIVFGGMHVIGTVQSVIDIFYIIPYSALGICFGLAYFESNTVFTPMVFHCIHNTVLTLLSILR